MSGFRAEKIRGFFPGLLLTVFGTIPHNTPIDVCFTRASGRTHSEMSASSSRRAPEELAVRCVFGCSWQGASSMAKKKKKAAKKVAKKKKGHG
jgi:hypothetical protein